MKYRDIRFEKNRERQSFDDYELSNRQIVRKNKRRFDKFYRQVLKGYLSGKYWDLLGDDDKDGIMYQWSYRVFGFYASVDSYKRLDGDVILNFVQWIKKKYKVDKSLLREEFLKELGI
jgi:hypothetical protein